MSTEPTTEAGIYLYHGIAVRGQEWKAADAITAIETEAREQGAREAQEALTRLREAIETEWYNGNMDEPARDRLLDEPTDAP